jgi:hypothetical protein
VLSQMALGWTFQLGELAANKNIPSLLISHGSHVASDSIYAQMEWKEHGLALTHTNYTHTVIQSPMAREYFTHNKVKSELLETGPLLFTKLQGKDKSKLDKLLPGQDGKFIIMHAGSARGIAARRFVVYETVDEYIENINSLIKVVENMSDDCFLIVRFRATEDLSLASLKELLIPSSKYSICAEGGFGDYLAITDVMVSYSSTTIDESLYNKIPVILFDSDDKYKHVPKAVSWKNFDNDRHAACCFASSEDELAETLSWFKNNYDLHQADWSQLMIESQPEKIRHLF